MGSPGVKEMIPAVLCQGLARAGSRLRGTEILTVVLELTEPFPPSGQGSSTDLPGLPLGSFSASLRTWSATLPFRGITGHK